MEIFEKGIVSLRLRPLLSLLEKATLEGFSFIGQDILFNNDLRTDGLLITQQGIFLLFVPIIRTIKEDDNGNIIFETRSESGEKERHELIDKVKAIARHFGNWLPQHLPLELMTKNNEPVFQVHPLIVVFSRDMASPEKLNIQRINQESGINPVMVDASEITEDYFSAFPLKQGGRLLDIEEMQFLFHVLYEGNKGIIGTFDVLLRKLSRGTGNDKVREDTRLEQLKEENKRLRDIVNKVQVDDVEESESISKEQLLRLLKKKDIQIGSYQNELGKLAAEEEKNKELKELVVALEEKSVEHAQKIEEQEYIKQSIKRYRVITVLSALSTLIVGLLYLLSITKDFPVAESINQATQYNITNALSQACMESIELDGELTSHLKEALGISPQDELLCSHISNHALSLAKKTGDDIIISKAYYNLGRAYFYEDNIQLALNCFKQALRQLKSSPINQPDLEIKITNETAKSLILLNDREKALDILESVIEAQKTSQSKELVNAYLLLAQIEEENGRQEASLEALNMAKTLCIETDCGKQHDIENRIEDRIEAQQKTEDEPEPSLSNDEALENME